MARTWTEEQFKSLMATLPAGTDYKQVRQYLIDKGDTLQGYTPPARNPFQTKQASATQIPTQGAGTDGSTPTPNQTQQQDTSFKDLPKHILPSAFNTVKGFLGAVFHPIQTVKALGKTAVGAVEQLAGKQDSNTETFDAVKKYYKDRYGSIEGAKKALINDPVGVALDVATVLYGAEGALSTVEKLGKLTESGAEAARVAEEAGQVSKVSKAAEIAGKVGKAIDPIQYLIKGTGKIADLGVKGAQYALGITTSVGADMIGKAFRAAGSSEFVDAMRGKITDSNIVTWIQDGLEKIKDQRSNEYQSALKDITKSTKQLDLNPVQTALEKQLAKFKIKRTRTGLDFSRSTIADVTEQTRIEQVVKNVDSWGSKAGDRTPIMVDTLKRRLGSFYSPSSDARALVTNVENSVKGVLEKNVKGYTEMTGAYEEASNILKDMRSELSVGGKSMATTTLRKLTRAVKDNSELRTSLIDELEKASGKDISAALAGQQMSEAIPHGGVAKLLDAGIFLATPELFSKFGVLLVSSPRAVGEFLNALGVGQEKTQPILDALAKYKAGLQKAATVGTETQQATNP